MTIQLTAGSYLGQPGLPVVAESYRVLESRYTPGTTLPRHGHERAHFCFVLDGCYAERVGQRSWERGPMSCAWYPSDTDHVEEHRTAGRHLLIELGPSVEFGPLPTEAFCHQQGPVTRAAHRVWGEFLAGDRIAVETSILDLLASAQDSGVLRGGGPAWMKRIDGILRECYVHPPRVTELAANVGVHPIYFARAYRRHRGESVADTIRTHRVRAAIRRIENPESKLIDVAVEVGFADQSHMTRSFRAVLGSTPGRWRELLDRH